MIETFPHRRTGCKGETDTTVNSHDEKATTNTENPRWLFVERTIEAMVIAPLRGMPWKRS
jgi:hypothetical protein